MIRRALVMGSAASLIAACSATVLATGVAHADNKDVTWGNLATGQYLNVAGDSHRAGAWIITWAKSGTKNELFWDHALGDGNFEERPLNTTDVEGNPTMCLDADGGRHNADVIQWPCNGGRNQTWKQGKSHGWWYLKNLANGQYLESSGVNAQVHTGNDCGDCSKQLWF